MRFEKGNEYHKRAQKRSPGRRPDAFKAKFREMFADPKHIDDEDYHQIFGMALANAKRGDPAPLMQLRAMAFGMPRADEQADLDLAKIDTERMKGEREAIGVERDLIALQREQTEFQLYFQQFCTSEQVKLLINQLYQAGLRTVQIINLETLREYAALPNGDELLRQAIGQNLEKATTETILAIPAFGAPEQRNDVDG